MTEKKANQILDILKNNEILKGFVDHEITSTDLTVKYRVISMTGFEQLIRISKKNRVIFGTYPNLDFIEVLFF